MTTFGIMFAISIAFSLPDSTKILSNISWLQHLEALVARAISEDAVQQIRVLEQYILHDVEEERALNTTDMVDLLEEIALADIINLRYLKCWRGAIFEKSRVRLRKLREKVRRPEQQRLKNTKQSHLQRSSILNKRLKFAVKAYNAKMHPPSCTAASSTAAPSTAPATLAIASGITRPLSVGGWKSIAWPNKCSMTRFSE